MKFQTRTHRDFFSTNEMSLSLNIEYYWKETTQIYLSNRDSDMVFLLNAEIEPELRYITTLDPSAAGPGVSNAFAMLDSIMPFNPEEEEVRTTFSAFGFVGIFPNPASSQVTFLFNGEVESPAINLYSIGGQLIKSFVANSTSTTIAIDDLSNGIYMVKFNLGNRVYSSSLIVLR